MFSYPEDSIYGRNSESENDGLTKYTNAFNNSIVSGHKKVLGGKSKKNKRKRKRKNKFYTLKKV
jgi:hypothetical protein